MLAQKKSALFSPDCRLYLFGSGDHTDKKTKQKKCSPFFSWIFMPVLPHIFKICGSCAICERCSVGYSVPEAMLGAATWTPEMERWRPC
jgi:hypothetical protein